MSLQRRLAAILAADVVGFAGLMGTDEDGTLAALQAMRRAIDPILTGHGGRIANTAGDSIVAEFPSVAEAVDAAVEVQRSPEVAGTGLRLRIGVNLGDVIVAEDGDIFGDGVNVAARLESLAPAGGVVVSGAVRDSLRGRSPVAFDDLGLKEVKHIDEPIRVHRARLDESSVVTVTGVGPAGAAADLLEREDELAALTEALDAAISGRGSVAAVFGEAGIGKSALVRAFAASVPDTVQVLWGWCDDLVTPRALGPLHDMAAALGPKLVKAIDEGGRPEALLRALLETLADGSPRLLILEDLHWADDATLDVLTFLGRRISGLPCLVVATARDTGASRVRRALAEAPPGAMVRVAPAPLSTAAIAALLGRSDEAEKMRRITGGNPFFVSELARSGTGEIPESVHDAVLARIERLSPTARHVVDAVSIAPTSLELDVVAALVPSPNDGVAEAAGQQILVSSGNRIGFRHELARYAVEASLPDDERRRLHAAVLTELGRRDADPARLVHHAARAGDDAALVVHALSAADRAAAMGAHREAASHYSRVLEHEDRLDTETLARVLQAHSFESYLLDREVEALDSALRLYDIHAGKGDLLREGDTLRWLSRLYWVRGDGERAHDMARRAVEVLEALGPTHELAMAYSARSQLEMLRHRNDDAVRWGARALELAHSLGDEEVTIHALTNMGTALTHMGTAPTNTGAALLEAGPERAHTMLAEARDRAIEAGFPEPASRAWLNLTWGLLLDRRWDRARVELEAALPYAVEHEIEGYATYLRGELAWLFLEIGDWEAAERHAIDALAGRAPSAVSRVPAMWALGTLLARRGDLDGAKRVATDAWELANTSGEPQRTGPVAILRVEIAWLEGSSPDLVSVALPAYSAALEVRYERWAGDLARWLRRSGETVRAENHDEPYRSEIEGRHEDAAEQWHALGVPYDEALAWYEAGHLDRAVEILEGLGAHGALRRVTGAM
jgi:class 3 adenylate cyclase/tetratricopeptide (TPR) repeat protein